MVRALLTPSLALWTSKNTSIAEKEGDFILPALLHASEALGLFCVLPRSPASKSPWLSDQLLAVWPWAIPCHGGVRSGICLGALSHLQASSSTRWRSQRWWLASRRWRAAGG